MNTWADLLNILHEGGTKAYFWTRDWKWDKHQAHSEWYDIEDDRARETALLACSEGLDGGPHNTYFPVHPLREIPPEATQAGSELFPWRVRGRIEDVQHGNCLFAEFDAKDYGTIQATKQHIWSLMFHPSIVVASGGGYHCYWLLDRPMTDTSVLKEAQYGWVRWNGGDPGAKDLARILRVPGTLNLKYAPPRKVEIVLWQPSTRYDFDRLLEHIPPPPPPPPVRIPTYQVDQNLGIYLAKIIREEYEYVALAPRGQRNTNLNTAAYILGGLVAGGLLDRLDVESSLTAAAMQAGLHEDKDCGMKGIAKTIASGLNRGMTRPRAQPANAFRDVGRDILGHILTARQGDTNNVADAM